MNQVLEEQLKKKENEKVYLKDREKRLENHKTQLVSAFL